MSRSQQTRTLSALAVTALAGAAIPLLGAAQASAETSGGCQSATVQYRLVDSDGKVVGQDWTSQGGFHAWDTVPGTVEVRLAPGQTVADGCTYPVSLAEYTTEGPNWNTSGHQTLVDKATVRLTSADVAGNDDSGHTWQKLSVKSPDCYGQIDLYGDDVTYDGKTGDGHGPAPSQPDNVLTPYHLIAAWNGGDKACTTGASDSPSPSASESTPGGASATPTTEAPSTPATASKTPTPVSTPTTTSKVPPLDSTPSASPSPSANGGSKPLAETGAGAPLGLIGGVAGAVVVAGAGAVWMSTRKRRA
ncbi:hypothetical protein [Streptomyces mangrovisoli]|uniref:Gram-positive cocci surface proteins LPxTG domain-containing protein n=1 Tax=Streptomyces mangrovisoli TaxID=1428628 RepID=A0A1J4NNM4_9ACTN|nr:hypothetical protein [Streptomyces mangrovisoli]OIJ62758.1 hypothetical protein WN71_037755 [Streptomyces mangrovisoli]